jgi:hypothetical protein
MIWVKKLVLLLKIAVESHFPISRRSARFGANGLSRELSRFRAKANAILRRKPGYRDRSKR